MKEKNENVVYKNVSFYLIDLIYRFLGNEITKEELQKETDIVIKDDAYKNLMKHKYLLKDVYRNIFVSGFKDDLDAKDDSTLNDIEEMKVK